MYQYITIMSIKISNSNTNHILSTFGKRLSLDNILSTLGKNLKLFEKIFLYRIEKQSDRLSASLMQSQTSESCSYCEGGYGFARGLYDAYIKLG